MVPELVSGIGPCEFYLRFSDCDPQSAAALTGRACCHGAVSSPAGVL